MTYTRPSGVRSVIVKISVAAMLVAIPTAAVSIPGYAAPSAPAVLPAPPPADPPTGVPAPPAPPPPAQPPAGQNYNPNDEWYNGSADGGGGGGG
ncbi:MAG: hypothetical protein WBZ15_12825 [Mycobacterium sp.]|uniref:hypothetical protein n=1 Tax=Mycobacterium sp. TaxID=1785 RepID=UPI003C627415